MRLPPNSKSPSRRAGLALLELLVASAALLALVVPLYGLLGRCARDSRTGPARLEVWARAEALLVQGEALAWETLRATGTVPVGHLELPAGVVEEAGLEAEEVERGLLELTAWVRWRPPGKPARTFTLRSLRARPSLGLELPPRAPGLPS